MVKMWYYAGMLFLRARELPTTKGEKMLKRGFISRSASVVTLVGALALLSSISGVTAGTIDDSVGNAQQSPSSLVFSSASADGFSYSRWLENQGTVPASADSASTDESQADQGQAPITYGSFVLTETPLERIYGNVKDSWTQTFSNIITRAGDTSMLRGWAMDYVTGQDVDIQAGIDSWWEQRQADTTGIFVGMADVLTDNIFQAGEDHVGGMSFIRSLDWDYQTELGDRPWQLGVNALGSLREANDDVILWQLRGFTAKDTKGGANAGLVYRRAHEDTAMLGVNAFLDFQSHDLGDFWRWSVGGEVRTEWLNFYGNRYIAITDPIPNADEANKWNYSRDGVDFGVVFNVPNISWVKGNIEYYLWEGEFGDSDKKGFIYGVNVTPPMAENVRVELKLNDQDGGDLDVGGAISYRHEFGGVPSGTRTAGASSFDPRDYFFEPVRRRYDQEIGTSVGGGDVGSRGTNAEGARMVFSDFAQTVTVDINNPSHRFSRANPITIVVSEEAVVTVDGVSREVSLRGTDIAGLKGSSYDISLSDQTKISFEEEGELVSLFMGNLYISRDGVSPERVATPNMGIRLIGTDLRVAYVPTATETAITLYTGEISLAYDSGASFEASVAGDAQIHDDAVNGVGGSVTYYACNNAPKIGNFIGVTSVLDCVLEAVVTPDPTAGTVIAAVGLPKGDLVHFAVSKGVGAYNLELTSNPNNYFAVVQDDSDSSIFRISVGSVGEEEAEMTHVIAWRLNDEFDGVDSGNITVRFTKAPSADNAVRYAIVDAPYTETIRIPVVGGVPDTTTGDYTFALTPATGYSANTSGSTIVLDATGATYTDAGVYYVTVSIYDSQTPPQSGTFVLEVRVVPVLTIAAPASALEIFQTESASLLSLVSGGNTDYSEATEQTFQIVGGDDGGNFSIGNDGVLVVGKSAPTVLLTLKVEVAETVPSQNATADVEVSVKFKASNVSLIIEIPESIDPDVNIPLTVTMSAAGGYGEYTYSLENEPSYISLNANVLVVGSPGDDTAASFNVKVEDNSQTFPAGVSNTDNVQINVAFMRPQASGNVITDQVEVTGTDSDRTYNAGEALPSFDPKTAAGVKLEASEEDGEAELTMENGNIVARIKWHASPLAQAFPDSGEWIFISAAEIVRRYNAGEQVNGLDISFQDSGDVARVTPNMAAILAPSTAVNDVVRSIPFMWCSIGLINYSCQVYVPEPSAQFSSSRSLAAEEDSTGPVVKIETNVPFTLIASKEFPTNAKGEDCRLLKEECTGVREKNVLVLGAGLQIGIDRDLLKRISDGGIGNLIQFATYNGRWGFGDDLKILDGFTLVYPPECTVTLPNSPADNCRSHIAESSSTSFASIN